MARPKNDASAPLTVRQQLFVVEFMVDLNAVQAAIRAGYSVKYANHHASELAQLPHVAAAIAAEMEERSKRTKINADWLLTRLAAEADADVADLYEVDGALRPVKDWPLIWRTGLVAGLDVEEMRVEGVAIGTIRKIKLSDRVKRLELIGKHVDVQAFREQVAHTSPDGSMTPQPPVYKITET